MGCVPRLSELFTLGDARVGFLDTFGAFTMRQFRSGGKPAKKMAGFILDCQRFIPGINFFSLDFPGWHMDCVKNYTLTHSQI